MLDDSGRINPGALWTRLVLGRIAGISNRSKVPDMARVLWSASTRPALRP
jgi:hypothetical protein